MNHIDGFLHIHMFIKMDPTDSLEELPDLELFMKENLMVYHIELLKDLKEG